MQKELLQRAIPKNVEIDVEEQINIAEIDTQLCKSINENSKNLSILNLYVKN
ncbi:MULTISPECIES: hypothetical protein [unclassified Wolbachia]|uniref:hypothetical protein n=1 Tax=unclassified Wolbachia TaxID=2640676 RepID=UPI001BBBBE91|nr:MULTISPECIES: hypothetical protein [unclassified Wolbachia]MBR9983671.1 hypothetical protein [Wolbachia endosymbiont of Homalodisca vitripennis]MCJ7454970.1 hypothetical protein [Wolbachia endosymbiont of Homalodisca vitripennis]MCJ7476267.1 hypothetical protein [Wolbachia endosymbiont of Homalodisca vitripennis]